MRRTPRLRIQLHLVVWLTTALRKLGQCSAKLQQRDGLSRQCAEGSQLIVMQ